MDDQSLDPIMINSSPEPTQPDHPAHPDHQLMPPHRADDSFIYFQPPSSFIHDQAATTPPSSYHQPINSTQQLNPETNTNTDLNLNTMNRTETLEQFRCMPDPIPSVPDPLPEFRTLSRGSTPFPYQRSTPDDAISEPDIRDLQQPSNDSGFHESVGAVIHRQTGLVQALQSIETEMKAQTSLLRLILRRLRSRSKVSGLKRRRSFFRSGKRARV